MNSKLEVVPLTAKEEYLEFIKDFKASSQGDGLENFLKRNAWEEDKKGSTKVYLVNDKDTDEIVFFFGLKAGLLYKQIGSEDIQLNETEREILKLCVEGILNKSVDFDMDEIFEWYEEDESINEIKLRDLITDRVEIKTAASRDKEETSEELYSVRVKETYPSIVLTHFCKNENYKFSEHLSFPIGFYVFWEIIVPKVHYIANLLGAQYLYLFAADGTSNYNSENAFIDMIYGDVDDVCEQSYKLVDYYKNELKFCELENLTILKPFYDYSCFSMIQSISNLDDNKKIAWIQHSDFTS